MPDPDPSRIRVRSADFVASYVNFYVCNGAVISAEFGDDTADAAAQSLLQSLYAGRTVVSLNVDPIGVKRRHSLCHTAAAGRDTAVNRAKPRPTRN